MQGVLLYGGIEGIGGGIGGEAGFEVGLTGANRGWGERGGGACISYPVKSGF